MAPKYEALAVELQSAIPEAKPEAAASLGGTIGAILALVTAIRSGDAEQIKAAVLALLTIILAPSTPGTQSALFGGGHKIDWSKVLGVIEKLLPIILGIVGA